MTSPPAAPGAGGRPARPKSKTGRPDGGTTGRRELARHARFAEISPEVGVLDERAMSQALADDPAAFELLAAMTTATDENLRATAIRLSASIVLERARAGRPAMRGISRLRPVRGATDGDLDIDASIEGVSAARSEARPVAIEDLTTVQWAKAPTAFAVVVDRSGSMSGPRLAAAATVAAACALRAPQEHAVLTFAGTVEVIRPLISDITPAAVAGRLLRMRGHGVTRLATALKAAGEQLAQARARRRVVILLSDCRSTDEDDTLPAARALPELVILAPDGDYEQAAHLAGLAGARWAAIEHPLDAAAALDKYPFLLRGCRRETISSTRRSRNQAFSFDMSGVMYQSSKSARRPFDRTATDSGTLRSDCITRPADVAINGGGRRADTRFPTERTNPPSSVDAGAQSGPTEAIPSVANSDALKFPPMPKAL